MATSFVQHPKFGIVVLVILLGLVLVVPSISGSATATACSGAPVLKLSPDPVLTGRLITAKVSGLTNCKGQVVAIKDKECRGGLQMTSSKCKDSSCSNDITFKITGTNRHLVWACVDRSGDGDFDDGGERAAQQITVVSLPDLAFGDKKEVTVKSGQYFVLKVPIVNKGTAYVHQFELAYELFGADGKSQTSGKRTMIVEKLNPGEEKLVALPAFSFFGRNTPYTLKLWLDKMVDIRWDVQEYDETNNEHQIVIKVT